MQTFISLRTIFIVGISVLFGCKNSSKNNDMVFQGLNESFEKSINSINEYNKMIYISLEDKTKNTMTAEKATIWYPRAMLVKNETKGLIEFIEQQKNSIKNATDEKASFFLREGREKDLFRKLKDYRNLLLKISPEINYHFKEKIYLIKRIEDESVSDTEFTTNYFSNQNAASFISELSKFENNITITENQIITFCHDQSFSSEGCDFSSRPRPLINQSTNSLKKGETLKILAGIGSFSSYHKPRITIDNKPIECADGIAVYKMKVLNNGGAYKIPVKIEYTEADGRIMSFTDYVEYTIIE